MIDRTCDDMLDLPSNTKDNLEARINVLIDKKYILVLLGTREIWLEFWKH